MDDEAAAPELTEEQLPEETPTPEKSAESEYIEYVGDKASYGTEFLSEHTVTRKQLRDAWGVDTDKDLRWVKAEGGPNRGRMLVPVADMSEAAAKGFEKDPLFRRVTLSN
jgi:hypothetical protein